MEKRDASSAVLLAVALGIAVSVPAFAAAQPVTTPPVPAVAAPVPEATIPKGWCVIAGEEPLSAFPLAAEQASRLRAAGYPAGVYDTRAFANLAWGELVIIARGFDGPDARAQATRLTAELGKGRGALRVAKAYAKPCEPLSPPVTPVKSAADLPLLPSLPTAPITLSPQLAEGCLAWSPPDRAALCVVGTSGQNVGEHSWDLRFLGLGENTPDAIDLLKNPTKDDDHPPPLSSAQMQSLERVIRKRGYVALSALARKLGPGETFHSAVPRFSIRWERRRTSRGGDNEAPQYRDRIFLRCGGPAAKEISVAEEEGPHEGPSLTMTAIPAGQGGGPAVVLTTRFEVADEGMFGTTIKGHVIDLTACKSVD